jgi:hypothetical protein
MAFHNITHKLSEATSKRKKVDLVKITMKNQIDPKAKVKRIASNQRILNSKRKIMSSRERI